MQQDEANQILNEFEEASKIKQEELMKDAKAEEAAKKVAIENLKNDKGADMINTVETEGGENAKKTFVDELGFKAPDMKDQMLGQSSSDPIIEDFIDQDASFIKCQEGYPNFFRNMPDKLSNVTFSNGTSLYRSHPFGVLDFYDSLM